MLPLVFLTNYFLASQWSQICCVQGTLHGSFQQKLALGGRYSIRITSIADDLNQDAMEDPFLIRALLQYSLLAVPASPGDTSTLGTFSSLEVCPQSAGFVY